MRIHFYDKYVLFGIASGFLIGSIFFFDVNTFYFYLGAVLALSALGGLFFKLIRYLRGRKTQKAVQSALIMLFIGGAGLVLFLSQGNLGSCDKVVKFEKNSFSRECQVNVYECRSKVPWHSTGCSIKEKRNVCQRGIDNINDAQNLALVREKCSEKINNSQLTQEN